MGSSPRLWLVDDDPEMAFIVKLLCRRGGQSLTHYDAVAPAWEALQAGGPAPDLLLLDLNLPVQSGLELLRRRGGGGPPVALFCQPGLYRDIAAGWAEGGDYLLAKDLVADPSAWSQRLSEILSHADGSGAGAGLEWMLEEPVFSQLSWGRTLSQELEHPTLRPLGGAVLSQVVRRALSTAFGPDAANCLHPVSGRVSAVALARPASVGQARAVFASLVDQVFRLVGRQAAVACERRLRDAWAGLGKTSGNGA
jgi:CheY-like chemotaxis protein